MTGKKMRCRAFVLCFCVEHGVTLSALEILVENIGRHTLDHAVAAFESRYPLAASGVENLALAAREIDDHAAAALDAFDGCIAIVADQRIGHEFGIGIGEELVVGGNIRALFLERRHAKRQNLQSIGCAAALLRFGQTTPDHIVEPVDLIAEGMTVSAQEITVIDAGSRKGPMFRAIDRKTAYATRAQPPQPT